MSYMNDLPDETLLVSDPLAAVPASAKATQIIVPLHGETVEVSRRRVETGVVQVATVTRSREVMVDETLTHQRVEVERVPVGKVVDAVPPVREEGDVTIIPIIEEIIVVEKRLMLKEEVHLRRIRVTEQHREPVILREQEAVVTRKEIGAVATN